MQDLDELKLIFLIWAEFQVKNTSKQLLRSPQNADHADCRLQTADRADHADCADRAD